MRFSQHTPVVSRLLSVLFCVEDRCTDFLLLFGSEISWFKISRCGRLLEVIDIVIGQVKKSIQVSDLVMNACLIDVACFGKLHHDGAEGTPSLFTSQCRHGGRSRRHLVVSKILIAASKHWLLICDC